MKLAHKDHGKNEEDEESDENKEDFDDVEKECPGGGRRLRNR